MAEGIQLTPEQLALAEQNLEQTPSATAVDLFQSLDAQGLADLAVQDKEFDPVQTFSSRQDLWGDQNAVQKVADADHLLRLRGFQMADLPGVSQVGKSAWEIARGFGKQAWNYANALVGVPLASAMGEATGQPPAFHTALAEEGTRRVAENIAGTESAVSGLSQMVQRGGAKLARGVGAAKPLDTYTPEDKLNALWGRVGEIRTNEEITRGKGAFMTGVGGEVVKGLEQAGAPVRPEEVQELSAGDPVSWWLFGKAFQGAGKMVPAAVGQTARAAAEATGKVAAEATGKAIELGGRAAAGGAAAVKGIAEYLPAIGAVGGFVKGGPVGALAGLGAGQAVKRGVAKGAEGAVRAGKGAIEFGKQVAGEVPVTRPMAQVVTDVAQAAPGAALAAGEGASIDLGFAAATSERPSETTNAAALGTFFGLGKAARLAGQRVVSGQIAAPRAWGVSVATPSTPGFGAFDQMHSARYAQLPPGEKLRVNAIRQVAQKLGADFFVGTPEQLESALTQSGVNPESARNAAQQAGFFTQALTDAQGKSRRVILATDVSAAPHEARHAMEDLIGEEGMRKVDELVKQQYANEWEQRGQSYTAQLLGVSPQEFVKSGYDWREVLSDRSGWGDAEAGEQIVRDVQGPTGGILTDAQRARVQEVWDGMRAQGAGWREVFTAPEDRSRVVQQISDRYLARELAAENFDAAFKNMGGALERTDLVGRLAHLTANMMQVFGAEPLVGRASEGQRAPLRYDVMQETVRQGKELPPVVQPKDAAAKPTPVSAGSPQEQTTKADEWAQAHPEVADPQRLAAIRALNGAIENGQGVRLDYLAAKGAPGGDPSAMRPERRAEIEASRGALPTDRQSMTKDFFPISVVTTEASGPQYVGWSPNNFRANHARLTDWIARVEAAKPGATRDLLPAGFDMENDSRTFVQNQMAGGAGSGRELVVPQEIQAAGYTQPKRSGGLAQLPQARADVVNYLFGNRLPGRGEKAVAGRTDKGLPLNLAGQQVAEATAPREGRVTPLVEPRTFEGKQAEKMGVAGQPVQEVNPFRTKLEAVARDAGVAAPELIEVQQRLNAREILDATLAPELERFGGNTLTLQAGFQPKAFTVDGTQRGEKTRKEFRAEDMAAARRMAENEGIRVARVSPKQEGELMGGEAALSFAQDLGGQFEPLRFESPVGLKWWDKARLWYHQNFASGKPLPQDLKMQLERVTRPAWVREGGEFGSGEVAPSGTDYASWSEMVNDIKTDWGNDRTWLMDFSGMHPLYGKQAAENGVLKWNLYEQVAAAMDSGTPNKSLGEVLDAHKAGAAKVANGLDLSRYKSRTREQLVKESEGIAAATVFSAAARLIDIRNQIAEGQLTGKVPTQLEKFEQNLLARQDEILKAFEAPEKAALKEFKSRTDAALTAGEKAVAPKDAVRAENEAGRAVLKRMREAQTADEQLAAAAEADKYLANTKEKAQDLRVQSQPKAVREYRELAQDSEKWSNEMKSFEGGRYGGGLTGAAHELGASITSVEQLSELRSAMAEWKAKGTEAMKSGNFDEAMPAVVKSQFFREALEAAVGGGSTEFIQNHYDKSYVPPMQGVQFSPRTETGKRLEKEGYKFRHAGGPLDRSVVAEKDGTLVGEITSTRLPDDAFMSDRMMQDTPGRMALENEGREPASDKTANLDFVEVNKDFRGKGVGEALYRELLTQLRDDGATHLTGMVVRPEPIALREKVSPGATEYFNNGEKVSVAEAMQAAERFAKGGRNEDGSWEIQALEPFTRIEEGAQYAPRKLTEEQLKGEMPPGYTTSKIGNKWVVVDNKGEEFSAFGMGATSSQKAIDAWKLTEEGRAWVARQNRAAKAAPAPKAEEGFAMKAGVDPEGFKKAWILPDGSPVQLGGQWHEDWLSQNNDITKKWGLETKPFEGMETEARSEALKKGFARVNYSQNGGLMTIEVRQVDWDPTIQNSIRKLVEANAKEIDFIKINLLNKEATHTLESDQVRLLSTPDAQKAGKIPFLGGEKEVKAVTPEESAATVEGPSLTAKQFADERRRYAAIRAKKFAGQGQPKERFENLTEEERDDLAMREAERYFGKGHGEENADDRVWMWNEGVRAIKDEAGEYTHGQMWGHSITDKTFKGRYDADSDTVSVVFPQRELEKLGRDWATEDDIPSSVFNALKRKYPKAGVEVFPKSRDELSAFDAQYQGKALSDPQFEEEVKKVQSGKSFGQTFNSDGSVWAPEDKKVDLVSLASVNLRRDDVTADSVTKAIKSFSELLDEPGVNVGIFSFEKDGKPMVSVDLNAVVPQEFRKNTAKFAKDNDQVAIWDAAKNEMVETGGKGDTKLTKLQEVLDALDLLAEGQPVDVTEILREYSRGKVAEQQALEGFEGGKEYNAAALADMTRAELQDHFPEAIVPRRETRIVDGKPKRVEPVLTSDVTESPLYKEAKGNEAKAVDLFANKLVKYVDSWRGTKAFNDGATWYSEFTPRLKKAFGQWADRFAELLAASSPQTDPGQNFRYAHEAVRSWQDGRFDKIITKFNEGLEMLGNGSWEKWLDRKVKSGEASDATAAVKSRSEATFLAEWIFQYNLKPRQLNGKLYGQHSDALLQVFARRWLDFNAGPKTRNFVENLLGISHGATIDLWADRTMRRLGYEGKADRWRILPKNQAGVRDVDFAFAQKVFEAAAKRLGLKADDLQGAAWFVEKVSWAREGWGRLDLGDYRAELNKLPALEQKYQSGKAALKPAKKTKKAEQQEFGLVESRR